MAGVTQPLVPCIGGDGSERVVRRSGCGRGHGRRHGVEIAVGITSEDYPVCPSFLDKEPTIIKLDVNRIIAS